VCDGDDSIVAPLSRASCKAAIFLVCVVCSYTRKRILRLSLDFTFSTELVTHFTNNVTALWFECKKKVHLNPSHAVVHFCGISGGTQNPAVLIKHAVEHSIQFSRPT
jgi:hypothetical protein